MIYPWAALVAPTSTPGVSTPGTLFVSRFGQQISPPTSPGLYPKPPNFQFIYLGSEIQVPFDNGFSSLKVMMFNTHWDRRILTGITSCFLLEILNGFHPVSSEITRLEGAVSKMC